MKTFIINWLPFFQVVLGLVYLSSHILHPNDWLSMDMWHNSGQWYMRRLLGTSGKAFCLFFTRDMLRGVRGGSLFWLSLDIFMSVCDSWDSDRHFVSLRIQGWRQKLMCWGCLSIKWEFQRYEETWLLVLSTSHWITNLKNLLQNLLLQELINIFIV